MQEETCITRGVGATKKCTTEVMHFRGYSKIPRYQERNYSTLPVYRRTRRADRLVRWLGLIFFASRFIHNAGKRLKRAVYESWPAFQVEVLKFSVRLSMSAVDANTFVFHTEQMVVKGFIYQPERPRRQETRVAKASSFSAKQTTTR